MLKKLNNLSEISSLYQAYIIDLWGVMHDGVKINPEALKAVKNLEKLGKRITFLSNAPRPNKNVNSFLKKINFEENFLNYVMTSGEAAVKSLQEKKFGKKFYHIGPPRDEPLFEGLEKDKTVIEKCEFILCTGLFDENMTELNYYKKLLEKHKHKTFVCTNPDLTVFKGGAEEFCAGAIAKIFENIGGNVIYFGKPHREVYEVCLKKNEKTLAIGDNLNTDIKGANKMNLDSIFITDGVHREEFKNENDLADLLKKYKVTTNYFQKNLKW
jgi:HAD superfamily hydrolase (TIGR01459 family)